MIPKQCKRLAEVDFPIAVVSKHAAREKSIRHGHPSTLHLWWARRPLAACRAMLLALLLPDPCDEHCPSDFKKKARELLLKTRGRIDADDIGLQQAILKFIADFADWDLSSDATYLEVANGLVKAAHPEETPLVVDPFAGGGSIPLEALRLGCEAFASDLNPVACLILKVMLEDIPRHGPKLADELRRVGAEIKRRAEEELAEFYPADTDGARPIAYLWARTVRCEAPNCGAEIPLVRSFWLCKKANRKRALRYRAVHPKGRPPRVEFEIFEPKSDREVPGGTVSRAKATCPCCGSVLHPDRVRAQLSEQRGGADVLFDEKGNRIGGARMLAVVTLRPGEQGRHYRLPAERDYRAVWKAGQRLQDIFEEWEKDGKKGLCPVPDEPLPPVGTLGFRVQRYGMLRWGDLFTARQKLGLVNLGVGGRTEVGGKYAQDALCLALGRCSEQASSLVRWRTTVEAVAGTFGRNALPIMWDFVEIVTTGDLASNYAAAVKWVAEVVEHEGVSIQTSGQVENADACESVLPDGAASVWFTDPPYYDAIPYSDLSDYFFAWFKRFLPGHRLLHDRYDPKNRLTPKLREAVQDETRRVNGRPKDREFFEEVMASAFAQGRRLLRDEGIASVVFAHKTTEGWEALLSGMVRGGWVITGSWPIATERPGRLRSQESAALATSVHLICRPRPEDAPVGDWADVLLELPPRVAEWMKRLQCEGIRGADLVLACIGPALEIFSRYTRVETAEGREVPLAEYLEKVWEVVGRSALQQVLGTAEGTVTNGTTAAALEEDARLTALFLWTMQSTELAADNGNGEEPTEPELEEDQTPKSKGKGFSLPFDVVRRFAQPLGIHLPDWEARIIQTEKGIVRIIPVLDRGKQLFGEEGATAVADELEQTAGRSGPAQLSLFPDEIPQPKQRRARRKKGTIDVSDEQLQSRRGATTLDRVHAAMLLQASGRASALRALLQTQINRSPDFLRLANALSALYPKGSDEKRLLDAMLLAVPR